MKANHPHSANLFSRLTQLTAEEGSNRIENFCTESLAWCLVASVAFCRGFLQLLKLPDEECEIYTQYSYSVGGSDEDETSKNTGLFDLLLTSKNSSKFAVIIEVKVWSGFGWNQAEKYRKAKKPLLHQFGKRSLVSITPFPDHHKFFDEHLQWWQIVKLLEDTSDEHGIQPMLRQFAAYLKDRGLGMVKLDPINSGVLGKR